MVRMREAAPSHGGREAMARAARALDAALEAARLLEEPGGESPAQAVSRLKMHLAAARACLGPSPRPAPAPEPPPIRVAVISSDDSIGDILSESLGCAGFSLSSNRDADAAVVYWEKDRQSLALRLAEKGNAGYVWVRGVTGTRSPGVDRAPAEVMDMPFKLEDLAEAVRRCADKAVGRR